MAPTSYTELEKRLTAAGNSLLWPPSLLNELLHLLDQTEELLSKVEQPPPLLTMQDAISPIKKALAAEELLKHSDADVKVGVASCISEILRISAPDAPYEDATMKDVFQLTVSCFENLTEVFSRSSYGKKATMLENMANVRSCVIMLDLGCEEMIIEMFQHFLRTVRVDYDSNMERIMTLVLVESEDISSDLLNPILATLNRNNDAAVMLTSRKLAERVILNSWEKIRPYLAKAVKSLDADFDDFGEVVSSLCAQEDMGSVMDSREDTVMTDSPKAIVSKGTNGTRIDQVMTDANSLQVDSHTTPCENIMVAHSDGIPGKTTNNDCAPSLNITDIARKLQNKMDHKPEEVEFSPDPAFDCVNGHKVKTQISPLLRAIFEKYGDITSGCEIKSRNILSFYLERLCDIYGRLEQTTFFDVTHIELNDMLDEVLDFEREKLNVGWLREQLEYIFETKISFQEYLSVEEEAANGEISIDSLEKEVEVYQRELSDLHHKSSLVQMKISAAEEKLEAIKGKADQSRKVALVIKTRVNSLWKQSLVHGLL